MNPDQLGLGLGEGESDPATCAHLGKLYRYSVLVEAGTIEPVGDEILIHPAWAYTVCADCGSVFTAEEMVAAGTWPARPAQ